MTISALASPYNGPEKLVIGLDIGTTTSAVTVCHLAPQAKPMIHNVQSWPDSCDEAKVPTLVAYSGKTAVSFGAKCLTPEIQRHVKEGSLSLAKWFKLSLHPRSLAFEPKQAIQVGRPTYQSQTFEIPALPRNTTVEEIYADFLKYLVSGAKKSFEESFIGAGAVWRKCESKLEFILAHPDGWEQREQGKLRNALDKAGLVKLSENRVTFVREAEASLLCALKREDMSSWLRAGSTFTIADLGGSTCDVCLYKCETVSPTLKIKEVQRSDCVQAGGVFVDREFELFVRSKLANSGKFNDQETITKIVKEFEASTKRLFRDEGSKDDGISSFVRFGSGKDNDTQHAIISGRFKVTSAEMKQCFEFCLNEILWSLEQETKGGGVQASHIILTGGFSSSPYLQAQIQKRFPTKTIICCDEPGKKAVAEGAVINWISKIVTARTIRHTIGIEVGIPYDSRNQEHRARANASGTFVGVDGVIRLRDGWRQIVRKGDVMQVSESVSKDFYQNITDKIFLGLFSVDVESYERPSTVAAPVADQQWCTDVQGFRLPGFSKRCIVTADLSIMGASLVPRRKGTNEMATEQERLSGVPVYYRVEFSIRLYVAETSLRATLCWYENGVEKEGPASIVFVEPSAEAEQNRRRRMAPENAGRR